MKIGELVTGNGTKRIHLGWWEYLGLCGGHLGVYMGKKSLTGAFKIHIFKPMQIIFQ